MSGGKRQLSLTPVELRAVQTAITRAIMVTPRSRRRSIPALERVQARIEAQEKA